MSIFWEESAAKQKKPDPPSRVVSARYGTRRVFFLFFVGGVILVAVLFMRFLWGKGKATSDNSTPVLASSSSRLDADAIVITDLAPVSVRDHVRGNRSAPINIIEFGDTECPYCKLQHPVLKQILSEYPSQVNWIYRHYPVTVLHKRAAYEAEALECVSELGGDDTFWQFLDKIYEVTPSNDGLSPETLPKLASDLRLNNDAFLGCLSSGKYTSKVENHSLQAELAGARGTPYTIIIFKEKKIPLYGLQSLEALREVMSSLK